MMISYGAGEHSFICFVQGCDKFLITYEVALDMMKEKFSFAIFTERSKLRHVTLRSSRIFETREFQLCYVTTTHPSPTPAIPWFCPRATGTQIQVTWIWDPVMKGCLTINCFFNDRHHVTFALVLYAVVQCKQKKKKEKSINLREGIQLKLTFVYQP